MIVIAALPLLLPLQDPALPRVLLEDLAGDVRERSVDAAPLRDPRAEGAVFARYLDAGRAVPPPGELDERSVVYLNVGDRVWGWLAGGEGERLSITLHGEASLDLQVEEIASILYPGRLPDDGSAEPEAAEDGDRLYLRRGRGLDKLDGLLNGFSSEGVLFEGRFGERTYPWKEIAAVFIEDLGSEGGEPLPQDVPVSVDLPEGGRLSGGLVSMDSSGVTLDRDGREVFLPAAIVRELALADGSYAFLSQVPVDDPGPVTLFGGADEFGMVYPHRVDRNCMNGPLRSGGRSWSRGIGVHAPSRLTWRLDEGWAELRTIVAVDDSVLRSEMHGSVRFRVLVDGELRWESTVLEGGDVPIAAPAIELAGASELVLEVDTATEAFVSDRANWLRPILVRG